MALEDLARELRQIADRLEKEAAERTPAREPKIDRVLPPIEPPPPPPPKRLPEHIRAEASDDVPVEVDNASAPTRQAERPAERITAVACDLVQSPEQTAEPEPPAFVVQAAPARPKPAPKPGERLSLEQRVGAKWFAATGAVVITAGVAFFTKLAWDAGWIQQVPPGMRCLIGAGFGGLLLAFGELARARINRFAGAGLSTAGVGALYASAYSAHVMGVVGAPAAFGLMAASAAVGIAVAVRMRLVSVAAFSLVGGYLVPVLLASPDAHPAVLPAYLLALLAVGLVLSAWQGGRFAVLRPLVLTATAVFGTAWTLADGPTSPGLALCFYSAAWSMAHVELLIAAWRNDRDKPHAKPWPPIVSLSSTIFAVGAGLYVCDEAGFALWAGPAAWTAALLVVWFVSAGHLRALRDRPTTEMEKLGAVAAVQAASLLALTVALAFTGQAQVAAWFALGVAGVVAGRWIGSRGIGFYGLALLGVGTARLIVIDAVMGSLATPAAAAGGLVLTPWLALMMVGAAGWMIAAFAFDDERLVRVLSGPLAWASLGAACLAWFHADAELGWYAPVWGTAAVIGAVIVRLRPRWHAEGAVVLALAAAASAWGVGYTPQWLAQTSAVGLSPGMLVAAILAVQAWAAAHLMAESFEYDGRRFALRPTLHGAIAVLVFAATSLEAARAGATITDDIAAQRALVSIWWGLFGVGMLVYGWRRGLAAARYVGLSLIAVATGKAVVFDMISVDRVWRVASFIGLGLMMLGVATAYARWIGPRLESATRTRA